MQEGLNPSGSSHPDRVVESIVEQDSEGARLDVWLSSRFNYRSRSEWQDAIRDGSIRVNSATARCSRRLKADDKVSFQPEDSAEPPVPTSFAILHENDRFIVIDKPGGLPSHPAGRYFKNTLWSLLKPDFGELHIVNRLDRETSGITIAAKDSAAASRLASLFASSGIHKKYLAIVHGYFPKGELRADGFLSRDFSSEVRKKRRFTFSLPPDAESESSSTMLRFIASNGSFSVVEATPSTGRLHQIRATLLSIGFPLAGDKLYGVDDNLYLRQAEGQLDAFDMSRLILPRQALHAASLSFTCPLSGQSLSFDSPIPDDIKRLYESCFQCILDT